MQIWVDADACPNVIKEILYRAADRTGLSLILVANQSLKIPVSDNIKMKKVASGFDAADSYIVTNLEPNDLVITADIPLAAEIISKGGHVINPRGERYTTDNIRQKLVMRDFMEEMRSSGQVTGGPPPLNQSDNRAFANSLDQFLARNKSSST